MVVVVVVADLLAVQSGKKQMVRSGMKQMGRSGKKQMVRSRKEHHGASKTSLAHTRVNHPTGIAFF